MPQTYEFMTGAELCEVQRIFDGIRLRPWYLQNAIDPEAIGSHLIHLWLHGVRDPLELRLKCEQAALNRSALPVAA